MLINFNETKNKQKKKSTHKKLYTHMCTESTEQQREKKMAFSG